MVILNNVYDFYMIQPLALEYNRGWLRCSKLTHLASPVWMSDSATLQSTQRIINAHYNQHLFSLRDLTTKYEANTVHVWRSRTPAGVRCANFFYCNHNIRGSGLKWKNRWRWLYDALIIHCVARIVAEPGFAAASLRTRVEDWRWLSSW
jgi:hypothetical protein